MALFFLRDINHYKRMGEQRKKNKQRRMKRRENERKEGPQGCEHIFYGMNGVGKQTNSILCSIKCCVIKRVVDGKGIGRRVN